MLLKDLWTGDLPVGGERSVGRGRLQGIEADMCWQDETWRLEKTSGGLKIEKGDREALETCVGALQSHLTKEVEDETAAQD
jgi:hypothetical protein